MGKFKHGMCHTRIYKIYAGAKDRCTRKASPVYDRYGGRGIKFLRNSFEDFYKDMSEEYYIHCLSFGEENTLLDRIDNNGNYCKENCRRATRAQQQNNTRYNKKIVYNGEEYPSIAVFCRKLGLNKSRVTDRIKYGRDIKDAVNEGLRRLKGITYEGKRYRSLRQLCKERGVKYQTVWKRMKDGLSLDEALVYPLHYKQYSKQGQE